MSDPKRGISGPVWLLIGLAVLYLSAWLLTATVGIAEVRTSWEGENVGRSAVETLRVEDFDLENVTAPPLFSPPRYFVGRYRTLVPFLITFEHAFWTSSGGLATRIRVSWVFGRMKVQGKETIRAWRTPAPSTP